MSVLYCIYPEAGPVQHLRIQPLTSSSLRIIWEPPGRSNSPVQYYVLRYKEVRIGNCDVDAAQWHPMIDTDLDVFQQELLDLVPYTKYDVMVWAKTRAGKGEPATETGLTEPTGKAQLSELYRSEFRRSPFFLNYRFYYNYCMYMYRQVYLLYVHSPQR